MVVALHVGGLSLVLLQGCKNDAAKGTASNADTNSTSMPYPAAETNMPSAMFATASNVPPMTIAHAQTNGTPPPLTNPITPYVPPAAITSNLANVGDNTAAMAGTGSVTPPQPAGPETDYKVQKGEYFSTIAAKHHITVSALTKANPTVDPRKLKVGQVIKVPAVPLPTMAAAGTGSTPPTHAAGAATAVATGNYTVKAGDNLSKIAREHGVTVKQIQAANNMKTTRCRLARS